MKKENALVCCPKCGEVADSTLRYCQKCKESLVGAAQADSHEFRRQKRRLKAEKRNIRARERREKVDALLEKCPILKPMFYILAVAAALGLIALLWKISTVSMPAFLITVTVLALPLYIWFATYVLNNIGCFKSRKVESSLFGAVVGGFLVIVLLIILIIMVLTE